MMLPGDEERARRTGMIWTGLWVLLTLVFTIMAVKNWLIVQRFPARPQMADLRTDAALNPPLNTWVTLRGVIWDCGDMVQIFAGNYKDTLIAFTDENRGLLGVATFSGARTCERIRDAEVSGVLSEISPQDYEDYREKGLGLSGYASAATRVSLCTWCGRGNSQLGIIVCAILALASLFLAAYQWRDWHRTH